MTTPDVRAAHLAQQAAIHPLDLYGDPHQPITISPPAYSDLLNTELDMWTHVRTASTYCGPAPADLIDGDLT